jgi:hypothetical protein
LATPAAVGNSSIWPLADLGNPFAIVGTFHKTAKVLKKQAIIILLRL